MWRAHEVDGCWAEDQSGRTAHFNCASKAFELRRFATWKFDDDTNAARTVSSDGPRLAGDAQRSSVVTSSEIPRGHSTCAMVSRSAWLLTLSAPLAAYAQDQHAYIQSTRGVQHKPPLISDDFVVGCIMIMFLLLFAFGQCAAAAAAFTLHNPTSFYELTAVRVLFLLLLLAGKQ